MAVQIYDAKLRGQEPANVCFRGQCADLVIRTSSCPLLAHSGHGLVHRKCPLSGGEADIAIAP
jgi:hypothetical protein